MGWAWGVLHARSDSYWSRWLSRAVCKSPAPRPRPHFPRGRLQDPRRSPPTHHGRPAQPCHRRPPSGRSHQHRRRPPLHRPRLAQIPDRPRPHKMNPDRSRSCKRPCDPNGQPTCLLGVLLPRHPNSSALSGIRAVSPQPADRTAKRKRFHQHEPIRLSPVGSHPRIASAPAGRCRRRVPYGGPLRTSRLPPARPGPVRRPGARSAATRGGTHRSLYRVAAPCPPRQPNEPTSPVGPCAES